MKLTAKGQLNIGDWLRIKGKSSRDDYERISVKDIVSSGDNEEVIINKSRNYYFITDMFLTGESWAEDIEVLEGEG